VREEFDNVTDESLEQVSGGLTCAQAEGMSLVFMTLGFICNQVGQYDMGSYYSGMGHGYEHGGCD